MASYAQIAQYSFDVKREDGTTRTYQMTFSEKGGSALSLDVPHTDELVIVEGDEGDARNKSIIVKQAQFRLKGKNSTLIGKLLEAGLRDIKVKIEDTQLSRELFEGYVVRAFDTYRLYEDVQEINVRAVVPFADLSAFGVEGDIAARNSLQEFFHEAMADVDLDKNIDFYTGLDHSTRAGTDGMPEEIELEEDKVAGGDDATLFDAMRGALIPFGWQLFQQNGRYIIADIYDRFANRAAITKWVDDGAGNYSSSTENIVITLDESTVVRGGNIQQLPDVVRYDHIHNFNGRNSSNGYELFSLFTVAKGSETARFMEDGMVRENDIIQIDQSDGQLTLNADPASNMSGDFGFLRVVIEDRVSGAQYHYDPSADEWVQGSTKFWFKDSYSFTAGGGSGQTATFEILNRDLAPVPEGVIGDVIVYQANEIFDTSGGTSEINGCEHENINIDHQTDEADATASRVYRADANPTVGRILSGNFFLGDEDQYFDSTFWYADGATGSRTNSWDWDGNTDTLGDAVAERLGTVFGGSGIEFKVRIRDVQNVTMLNAFEIDDNDGVTRVCLPKKIKLEASAGFYTVTLREVFNGFNVLERERYSESFSSGVGVGSGSTVSGASTGASSGTATSGGGTTDHGQLLGLDNDDHEQYMHVDNARTVTAIHNFTNSLQIAGNAVATEVANVTNNEFQQIQNIDSVTVSNAQWEYVGELDQSLNQAASPTFSSLSLTGALNVSGLASLDGGIDVDGEFIVADGTGNISTAGKLFVAGISSLDGGINVNDNFTVAAASGNVDTDGTLTVAGVTTLNDNVDLNGNLISSGKLEDDGFATGFQGTNWQLLSTGDMELENLLIRGGLTAYEAIINRVRYSFGNRVLSAGGGKIASVSGTSGSETITFEDPEGNAIIPVAEGDIMYVQNWDLDRTTIIKRLWRRVSSITGTDISLTTDGDMPADSGSLAEGDEFVVVGNDGTTADRDAIIYSSVTETTFPFIKFQDNVNSYTDWTSDATSLVIMGDLTDAPALSNGTVPSGVGFFAKGGAYLEGEIVASSGEIAGWSIESGGISKGSLNDGRIEILSDNSFDATGAHGGSTELGIPTILIMKQDTDFSDRMYLSVGETFVAGWTGRIGISMTETFSDSTPYFELSKDAVSGDITANIASWNFDDARLYNYDSNGGVEINASNQFIKMYEDNGVTARLSIFGDDTTLPTSATVRDSISGTSGAITSELTIVNYEPITGSWQPEETAGSGTSTFDYTLRYQGYDGSSWVDIETVEGSLAGSSVGVTRDFAFNDITGYSRFRMRIEDRNSSGGNWAFADYDAKQIKTEMLVNRRGMAIIGGYLRMIDFPRSTTTGFDPANLDAGTVFSDEKDGNGNWILKSKA